MELTWGLTKVWVEYDLYKDGTVELIAVYLRPNMQVDVMEVLHYTYIQEIEELIYEKLE